MAFRNKTALFAACLLALSLAGCTKSGTGTATVATAAVSVETTAATTAATEAAPAQISLAQQEDEGSLKAWELTADVWSSSNGAAVTVTAQPREHVQGQAASFVVRLNGAEVENRSCQWDGSCYTATVDLEAADGYEYDFVLFPPQGSSEHFSMGGAYDTLVNLAGSLSSYCNLFISDYKIEDSKFCVTAGFANVQLPQLTPENGAFSYVSAQLAFKLNGETIESCQLELPAGEGADSYEAALSSISFNMPQMENDYQLDLDLEVTFSDGSVMTANGGSWYFSNGEPQMNVG